MSSGRSSGSKRVAEEAPGDASPKRVAAGGEGTPTELVSYLRHGAEGGVLQGWMHVPVFNVRRLANMCVPEDRSSLMVSFLLVGNISKVSMAVDRPAEGWETRTVRWDALEKLLRSHGQRGVNLLPEEWTGLRRVWRSGRVLPKALCTLLNDTLWHGCDSCSGGAMWSNWRDLVARGTAGVLATRAAYGGHMFFLDRLLLALSRRTQWYDVMSVLYTVYQCVRTADLPAHAKDWPRGDWVAVRRLLDLHSAWKLAATPCGDREAAKRARDACVAAGWDPCDGLALDVVLGAMKSDGAERTLRVCLGHVLDALKMVADPRVLYNGEPGNIGRRVFKVSRADYTNLCLKHPHASVCSITTEHQRRGSASRLPSVLLPLVGLRCSAWAPSWD